jgi:hypothetical protein
MPVSELGSQEKPAQYSKAMNPAINTNTIAFTISSQKCYLVDPAQKQNAIFPVMAFPPFSLEKKVTHMTMKR